MARASSARICTASTSWSSIAFEYNDSIWSLWHSSGSETRWLSRPSARIESKSATVIPSCCHGKARSSNALRYEASHKMLWLEIFLKKLIDNLKYFLWVAVFVAGRESILRHMLKGRLMDFKRVTASLWVNLVFTHRSYLNKKSSSGWEQLTIKNSINYRDWDTHPVWNAFSVSRKSALSGRRESLNSALDVNIR
jgi:hypothetical protein